MTRINRIVCSLLLLWSLGATAQKNQSYFLHTIEKGQSLYSIAAMYSVNRAEIIRLNPGSDQRIYQGKTLKIPRTIDTSKATFHTIQPGETLYALTKQYEVSAAAICQANPGLSAKNFKIGQVIRIPAKAVDSEAKVSLGDTEQVVDGGQNGIAPAVKPACRDMHKVKRKETIYSISREYGITEEELMAANPELKKNAKLKRGSFLCIPYSKEQTNNLPKETVETVISNSQLFSQNEKEKRRYATLKVAVILPFLDGVPQGESARMVEYYEGFLLAVNEMKRLLSNIDLYTYNSGAGSHSLNALLAQSELKEMDIIFGPLYQEHIEPLAQFAKKNKIRLVIPFTSKDNTVFQNPYVYQINTPQSYLYSEVYDHFLRMFPAPNVVFIHSNEGAKAKAEFIGGLKEELKKRSIPMQTVSDTVGVQTLRKTLRKDRDNIFIPISGSNTTLLRTLPPMTQMVRELAVEEEEAEQKTAVRLFGYPEWQTYTKDHLDAFFELDAYFYASFYTNNLLPAAVQFTSNYRHWYGKEMEERYPKYGMLGYDTAYYFLYGLSRFGTSFEEHLGEMEVTPIQTGFKFQRVNNWGGFINKKVFFVHFTKNYELIKLDFE